jgi:hypothetical protein
MKAVILKTAWKWGVKSFMAYWKTVGFVTIVTSTWVGRGYFEQIRAKWVADRKEKQEFILSAKEVVKGFGSLQALVLKVHKSDSTSNAIQHRLLFKNDSVQLSKIKSMSDKIDPLPIKSETVVTPGGYVKQSDSKKNDIL